MLPYLSDTIITVLLEACTKFLINDIFINRKYINMLQVIFILCRPILITGLKYLKANYVIC